MKIFSNFLFKIAKLRPSFTIDSRKSDAIAAIREKVGDKDKILVLVSGGVDSSVCAMLCQEAIGADRVYALHVDTGFMREGESKFVHTALDKHFTTSKEHFQVRLASERLFFFFTFRF